LATQFVVLESRQKNNGSTVVVHTETPAGSNAAGVVWATALSESFGGVFVSAVPVSVMPGGRQAELDAGTRFEWSVNVQYDANDTNVNKLAAVESAITADEPVQLVYFQNRLRFWGQTGSV